MSNRSAALNLSTRTIKIYSGSFDATARADLAEHLEDFTNPHAVDATDVGLGNVDNTADADKPISAGTAAALALKAPLASPALTGIPTAPTATLGTVTQQIATAAFVQAAINALPLGDVSDDLANHLADTANPHVTTAAQIGLGAVDNTADVDKPVSGPQQAAINAVAADADAVAADLAEHTGNTANPHSVTKAQVGLAAADNTADLAKPVSAAQQAAINVATAAAAAAQTDIDEHLIDTSNPHAVDALDVGLGNVNNTADLDKPVSTATQSAINAAVAATGDVVTDLAAHLANTDNPHLVSKADVGLGAVDNTSDADKPVSAPQQIALNLKAPLLSPVLTGLPIAPLAAPGSATAQIATTEFVQTAIATTAGPTGDELAAHLADYDNPHQVTAELLGLGNVDNTSDADKPISDAVQAVLDELTDAAEDANIATAAVPALVSQTPERPGDALALYGSAKVGTQADLPPEWVETQPAGAVVRVDAAAATDPQTIATVAAWPIEPGRVYDFRWKLQRQTDPADPLNDAAVLGIRWLANNKLGITPAGVGTTIIESIPLVVADGIVERSARVAAATDDGIDVVAPVGAIYARPFVDLYGDSHVTDIIVIEREDITAVWDAGVVSLAGYKGTWNAATNTPTITSGAGTAGDYYWVATPGSTSIDGISTWAVGDIVAFNGTVWQKIPGAIPTLPIATTASLGAVRPDGATISVQPDGLISTILDQGGAAAGYNTVLAASIASAQQAAIRDIAERRGWAVRPSYSAIALPEMNLPGELAFTRAGTARRVAPSGLLEALGANDERHGYGPGNGEYLGVLLEPALANIWQRSEDVTDANIVKVNTTVVANQGLGADGTLTADLVREDGANTFHYIHCTRSSQIVAQIWTLSFWVRAAGRSHLRLEISDGGLNLVRANFELAGEGGVSRVTNEGTGTGARGRISRYPDGLYRVQLSGQPATAGASVRGRLYLLSGDTVGNSYLGDATSGVHVWGGQLKALRTSGSYVPNLAGSTTTQVAEALAIAAPGTWFSAAEGGFYYQFFEPEAASLARTLATVSNGTANESIVLRLTAADTIEAVATVGGVAVATCTGGYMRDGAPHRVLVTWATGFLRLAYDGAPVVSAALATPPVTTRIDFGGAYMHYYQHAAIFRRAPAGEDAQAITAPDLVSAAPDAIEQVVVDGLYVVRAVGPDGTVYPRSTTADEEVTVAASSRKIIGAVTASGFRLTFDVIHTASGIANYQVALDAAFTAVVATGTAQPPTPLDGTTSAYLTQAFTVTGLAADTEYWVRLMVDGNFEEGSAFHIRTLPAAGSASAHKLLAFSCISFTASSEDAPAFRAMAQEGADLAVCLGDWHYGNIDTNDIRRQRSALRFVLDNSDVQGFLAVCPTAYITDDHDTGPNNIERNTTFASTTALQIINNTQAAYRETWPHYPLVHTGAGPDSALTQQFDVGKVRHILLDMRSQRAWNGEAAPSVLGNGTVPAGSWDQVTWFRSALTAAGAAGCVLVCVHLSSMAHDSVDGWYTRAPAEYVAICNYIRDTAGIPQVLFISGDVHHNLADDRTYTDLSTGGGMSVPQITCSPVHQSTSGGEFILAKWLGSAGTSGTRILNKRSYTVFDITATGAFTATVKGEPFDGGGLATTLADYSSADAVPTVAFSTPSATASSGGTFSAPVSKTWFGPIAALGANNETGSLHWQTNEGSPQSGTLYIRPNRGVYTITGTMPAVPIIITLSAPSAGLALGAQTTITINPV